MDTRAVGKTSNQLGSPGFAVAASIISCFVTAVSLELLTVIVGAMSWNFGLIVGLLVGLVVAMTMLSDAVFSGWGWTLYFVQAGYRVTYVVIMGVICGIY